MSPGHESSRREQERKDQARRILSPEDRKTRSGRPNHVTSVRSMTGFIFDRERSRGVRWHSVLAVVAVAAAVASGCGGGKGTVTKPDGGADAPDADAPRMGVVCPA